MTCGSPNSTKRSSSVHPVCSGSTTYDTSRSATRPHRHEADAVPVDLEREAGGAVHLTALRVRAGWVSGATEVGAQLRSTIQRRSTDQSGSPAARIRTGPATGMEDVSHG